MKSFYVFLISLKFNCNGRHKLANWPFLAIALDFSQIWALEQLWMCNVAGSWTLFMDWTESLIFLNLISGWDHLQTIENLLRKGGYRSNITQSFLDTIVVNRYQSEKLSVSYQEYESNRSQKADKGFHCHGQKPYSSAGHSQNHIRRPSREKIVPGSNHIHRDWWHSAVVVHCAKSAGCDRLALKTRFLFLSFR